MDREVGERVWLVQADREATIVRGLGEATSEELAAASRQYRQSYGVPFQWSEGSREPLYLIKDSSDDLVYPAWESEIMNLPFWVPK